MPVLVQRLNATNLEGTDGMEEKFIPAPSQKPHVMTNVPENSEEVRILLAEITTLLVSTTDFNCIRAYVDDIVNICRALCMDPAGQVIAEGCSAMNGLAEGAGDQLMHFCLAMGRSIFSAFAHRHAKVRIAGLKCLYNVLTCGKWKTSADVISAMIGFRDPNVVPIKDFYDP